MDKKRSVKIREDLYEQIEEQIKSGKLEFNSVEEYVESMLNISLKKEEKQGNVSDEEKIKSRLRRLGYF